MAIRAGQFVPQKAQLTLAAQPACCRGANVGGFVGQSTPPPPPPGWTPLHCANFITQINTIWHLSLPRRSLCFFSGSKVGFRYGFGFRFEAEFRFEFEFQLGMWLLSLSNGSKSNSNSNNQQTTTTANYSWHGHLSGYLEWLLSTFSSGNCFNCGHEVIHLAETLGIHTIDLWSLAFGLIVLTAVSSTYKLFGIHIRNTIALNLPQKSICSFRSNCSFFALINSLDFHSRRPSLNVWNEHSKLDTESATLHHDHRRIAGGCSRPTRSTTIALCGPPLAATGLPGFSGIFPYFSHIHPKFAVCLATHISYCRALISL